MENHSPYHPGLVEVKSFIEMIDIKRPEECCGCGACVQICPKQCIEFKPDESEGFCYPVVDLSRCIHCNACERVCPELNKSFSSEPLKVLAAANPDDDIRFNSSSGGVFSMLASEILSRGGTVFGVAMADDCRSAHHVEVTDIAGLEALRGSKYIQANTEDTFKSVRQRLKNGCLVLYSGTPCQIRGLKLFLGKALAESSLLLCVDLICHGTPSPAAWRAYLDWRTGGEPIYGVNFRDKLPSGWRSFGLSLQLRPYDLQPSDGRRLAGCSAAQVHAGQPGVISQCHRSDLFMRSFLSNVNLRPSCYDCPANNGRSGADLTLADFWGIEPKDGDEAGVSQILVRTNKGAEAIGSLNLQTEEYPYTGVLHSNPCVAHSVARPRRRAKFWKYYRSDYPRAVKATAYRDPFIIRVKTFVARLLGR